MKITENHTAFYFLFCNRETMEIVLEKVVTYLEAVEEAKKLLKDYEGIVVYADFDPLNAWFEFEVERGE